MVGINPFFWCYFARIPHHSRFYVQANSSFGTGSGSESGTAYTYTTFTVSNGKIFNEFIWGLGADIGFEHLLYKRVAIAFSVGYNYTHLQNDHVINSSVNNNITNCKKKSTSQYTLDTDTNAFNFSIGFLLLFFKQKDCTNKKI